MDDSAIYPTGTIIDGRYRIDSRLGRGGFATVYRAQHLKLDRPAALKVLEPVAPFISDRFYARFETEARIAANLDHPNVVRIFDYGMIEPDQRPYIAMEMLSGRDLEAHLDLHGALEPPRAKTLFVGVLDALREGHERGVVHKDLKPSNLFIVAPDTPSERLVVLDYGIAWLEGDENPRYTEEGQYTGTPAYMPPEYIRDRTVTPAFDVYQLGLIFIEALTGEPVVVAGSNLEYMVAHMEGKHRVPDGFGDSSLGATLLKAIAVDPADRYQNAGEMLEAVRIADFDETRDYTLPMITEEDLTARRKAPDSTELPSPRHEEKRNTGLWVAAALFAFLVAGGVLLAVGGGVAWYYFSGDEYSGGGEVVDKPVPLSSPTPMNIPGTDREVDRIRRMSLATQMIVTVLYQVHMFEKMRREHKLPAADLFVPEGTETTFAMAYQNLEAAEDHPSRTVRKSAGPLREALEDLEVAVVDLHDYYKVKRGYVEDGGAKGKKLQKKVVATAKKARDRFARFERASAEATDAFFATRLEEYEDSDPLLKQMTTVFRLQHRVAILATRRPDSPKLDDALTELEEATDRAQKYLRSHRGEVEERFRMTGGAPLRLLSGAKTTYKKGRKVHGDSAKKHDTRDAAFQLRIHYLSSLQNFLQILRY